MSFPYEFPFYFDPALGEPIIMRARIAFDTDPFAVTPTWTNVDSDLLSFSCKKGRKHQLDRMEAGTATIILNNNSGNY